MSDTAAKVDKITTRQALGMIFKDRQVLAIFILGLASGLPYVVIGGTLNAWFSTVGLKTSTIGLLSWTGLAYAFKFMWAAALQSRRTPFKLNIGPRRFWMFVFQILITIGLFVIAFSNPPEGIGTIAIVAVLIAIISASFDIVSSAWRIESARDEHHLDILSTMEQFGYRTASFLGGALALVLADHIGWKPVFIGAAGLMAFTSIGIMLAQPTPKKESDNDTYVTLKQGLNLPASTRNIGTLIILCGWITAFYLIGSFMVGAITDPEHHRTITFMREQSPFVIVSTVGLLCLVSTILVWRNSITPQNDIISGKPSDSKESPILDVLFVAILEPMMELITRFKWATVLILALVMTYRFTDAIWGSFAYLFYLGENNGALGHTLTEVGLASKTIGVLATIVGIALGGLAMLKYGRMPVLVVGAVLAAVTNFLYADLASGAHGMDAFLSLTHMDGLFASFKLDQRMARLIVTIAAENVAGGVASAATIAYLSSIVNKNYAAVQYALLGSLTFLFGILGRPLIGEIIEERGFEYTFILCAWLGVAAVVLSILEWIRQSRAKKP